MRVHWSSHKGTQRTQKLPRRLFVLSVCAFAAIISNPSNPLWLTRPIANRYNYGSGNQVNRPLPGIAEPVAVLTPREPCEATEAGLFAPVC